MRLFRVVHARHTVLFLLLGVVAFGVGSRTDVP